MATLSPGILSKLLDCMKTGAPKPTGEHRNALLQVTDIVPVDLDEKDLWPKHGFYVKVSDSSHSIYVSLPLDQNDLVLSNKLQLGQFIHVARLEPGSPVPVIVGTKPLPGRHPLVGTPEPIVRVTGSHHRRGSWGPDQYRTGSVSSPKVDKPPTTPAFEEERSPVLNRARSAQISPLVSRRMGKEGSSRVAPRSPASGELLSKRADSKEASSASLRKSCAISRFSSSKNLGEQYPNIPKSPFPIEKNATAFTTRLRSAAKVEDFSSASDEKEDSLMKCNQLYSHSGNTGGTHKQSSENNLSLPGKLSRLEKEAMQHSEAAQKVALQALRDTCATETVFRILKMFSDLSTAARPEAPAACFDQFLSFHQEIVKAVSDLEAIQEATSVSATSEESTAEKPRDKDDEAILQEMLQNSIDQRGKANVNSSKRRAVAPETSDLKVSLGKHSRLSVKQKTSSDRKAVDDIINDENKPPTSSLRSSIKLTKKIRKEAALWFMEFLEAALESGLKKTKVSMGGDGRKLCCCPRSLILRVINWVEVEQSDCNKRPVHPRVKQIARRLRIKAKNP